MKPRAACPEGRCEGKTLLHGLRDEMESEKAIHD